MTNLIKGMNRIYLAGLLLLAIAIAGSATILTRARTQTVSLTVTNSTSRQIKHLYLAPPDTNNWGSDLMSDGVIAAGASATFNISCDQASTKVIAEDQNGCFVSTVVSCGGNAAWTITNDVTPDCGG